MSSTQLRKVDNMREKICLREREDRKRGRGIEREGGRRNEKPHMCREKSGEMAMVRVWGGGGGGEKGKNAKI